MARGFVVLWITLVAGALVLPSSTVGQGTPTGTPIVSTGLGEIVKGNKEKAREEALEDSKRKALVQAVGLTLPLRAMEEKGLLLGRVIYRHASDYIRSYRILSEGPRDGRYLVTLQCDVDLEGVEQQLVAMNLARLGPRKPRALILMAVQEPERSYSTCWWSFKDPRSHASPVEIVLGEEFQKQGFYVVDVYSLHSFIPPGGIYGCLDLSLEAVQDIGGRFDAEVVLAGYARTEEGGRGAGLSAESVQAEVFARAVRVSDGVELGYATSYSPLVRPREHTSFEEAFRKGGLKISETLMEQILAGWGKEDVRPRVRMRVTGISSFPQFLGFKEELEKAIPEIEHVYHRGISRDLSIIEVETQLTSRQLAGVLRSWDFESFDVRILGTSKEEVRAELSFPRRAAEPGFNPLSSVRP